MDHLRRQIISTVLYPRLEFEASDLLKWRSRWRRLTNCCEVISRIVIGASTICAFTGAFMNLAMLSHVAGLLGIVAILLLALGIYAKNESEEKLSQFAGLMQQLKSTDIMADEPPNATGAYASNAPIYVPTVAPQSA